MIWARMLAYIKGTVDQKLLLRNEYLAAENRILKAQIKGRLLLCDGEGHAAEIAYRLGRKALAEGALVTKPETIQSWYRKLVAKKFDGYKSRSYPGRSRVEREIPVRTARWIRMKSHPPSETRAEIFKHELRQYVPEAASNLNNSFSNLLRRLGERI